MARKQARKGEKRQTAKDPERGGQRGFYILLGIVAVAGIVFLVTQMNREGEAARQFLAEPLTPAQLDAVEGVELGPDDAPVLIEEFSDFMCPACASYNALHAGVIKERLVETGQARYVFYHFPIVGPVEHGILAARASRCAEEQGAFWPYADVLYGRQPDWRQSGDAARRMVGYADDLGLDRGEFSSCLYSDRYAREVTANFQLGRSRGVQGTPTVFVNGEAVDDFSASNVIRRAEEIVRTRSGEREAG